MKVVHVSTFERTGGAAIAASRLHEGLLALGLESTLLVRDRTPCEAAPHVVHLGDDAPSVSDAALQTALYTVYQRRRVAGVDTLFSTDLPTRAIADLPVVRAADVINVHWATGTMSAPAMRGVQDLGKPVVWTLHDEAGFTGGCHYSGPCRRFESDCGGCPQLEADARHVPALLLAHKRRWLDVSRLAVVCPSKWMAGCARRSALLGTAHIETIPNGVPVALYQRTTRAEARARLGLPAEAVILLVGGHRLDERRKGYGHVGAALDALTRDARWQRAFDNGDVLCMAFGDGGLNVGGPLKHLGRLTSDDQLALAYRAADVFLLPTLEDNLPNTLVESVAAGTPVVAYDTGGVPDILTNGRCGLLVPHGDIGAFAEGIRTIVDDGALRRELGVAGEAYARAALDTTVQAGAYIRLYDRLLATGGWPPAGSNGSIRCLPSAATGTRRTLQWDEAELLTAAMSSPGLTAWLLNELTRELEARQRLLDERGGEIAALRAELDTNDPAARTWPETLRQVETNLAAVAADRERLTQDLAAAHARTARAEAERAALQKRLRGRMPRVAVYGSDDHARRVWEMLSLGGAEVVAFIDGRPGRQGRAFLSASIQPPSWLASADIDLVAVADNDFADPTVRSALACVDTTRILTLPVDASDERLAKLVAARVPGQQLSAMHSVPTSSGTLRVGIFGTGAAAMKVWEALADIDSADVVWFADNNKQRQGQPLLWLNVIAPEAIPTREADVVVIGSMSRDAIRTQLRQLGIPSDRILAPDPAGTIDQLRQALEAALAARGEEVAP